MPKSFLEDIGGLYNPTLRFAFTNITEERFTSFWDKIPINVEANQTIEVSNITPIPGAGHALAIKMTGELVDKIMIGEAKMDEVAKNQPYYRSPKGGALGVPAARQVYENKILRQLDPDEESPVIKTMRKQMLDEIQGANEKQKIEPVHVPTSLQEFAEIRPDAPKPMNAPKKPAKVKTVKE